MSEKLALGLWAAAMVTFFFFQTRARRELECLPSAGWFLIMALPLWVQWETLAPPFRNRQLFGVLFLGACLTASDFIFGRAVSRSGENWRCPSGFLGTPILYVIGFATMAVVHFLLMDQVPLWEKYAHHGWDEATLQVMREKSFKLLGAPVVLKYAFNWALFIMVPVGFALFWDRKQRISASLFAVAGLLYANLTLARLPSLLLIGVIGVLLWDRMAPPSRRKALWVAGILGVFLALYTGVYCVREFHRAKNPSIRFNWVGSEIGQGDPREMLTIGDYQRLKSTAEEAGRSALQRIGDYSVYRLFLVPVEVSARWYQYFPAFSGGFVSWEGLLPGSRGHSFVHPANRVGVWAFMERFPDRYLNSVHAYASVDADVHARFGLLGIVFAGALLVAVRWSLQALLVPDFLSRALQRMGLCLMGVLLPMGSLQALLVANGLALLILLMFLHQFAATGRKP